MAGSRPTHLRAEPVRHPEIRAHRAEELADHRLASAWPDHEASTVAIMENPGPPRLLADPRARLVGLQDGAGQQPVADQARLAREGAAAGFQHVGESALADLQPEHIGHQPRQSRERDCLGETQVQHESPQVWAERRTRRQPSRRRRPEPLPTTRAEAAMQRYARYLRHDLRDLDPVIGMNRRLQDRTHIGPTMLAAIGQDVAPPRRVRMEGPVRAGMGLGLRLRLALAIGLVPLTRGDRGIVRRFGRLPQFRLQRLDTLRQHADLFRQRLDQRDQLFFRERSQGVSIH